MVWFFTVVDVEHSAADHFGYRGSNKGVYHRGFRVVMNLIDVAMSPIVPPRGGG